MWTTRLSWIVLLAVGCAGKHPGGNDDTAWWLLPDLGDGDDDDGDDDDDDDDDEADFTPGAVFWGEAFLTDDGIDGGAIGFYLATDDDGLVCEVEYVLAGATAATDCSECSFAYALQVGELDFSEGDETACAGRGWTDLAGATVKAGGAGERLYTDLGDGWQEAGASELDGEDWFFEGQLE